MGENLPSDVSKNYRAESPELLESSWTAVLNVSQVGSKVDEAAPLKDIQAAAAAERSFPISARGLLVVIVDAYPCAHRLLLVIDQETQKTKKKKENGWAEEQ